MALQAEVDHELGLDPWCSAARGPDSGDGGSQRGVGGSSPPTSILNLQVRRPMSHLEPEELIFSEVNSSGSAVHGLFRQPVVVTMKEAREPPFFREVEPYARSPTTLARPPQGL
jgi:hypothetical protein